MSREQVFDDPLSIFAAPTEEAAKAKPTAAAQVRKFDDEPIRSLNTSKMTLKGGKAKAGAVPIKEEAAKVVSLPEKTKESRVVGAVGDLWGNTTKDKTVVDVLAAPNVSTNDDLFGTKDNEYDDLFGSKEKKKAESDFAPSSGSKAKGKVTSGGLLSSLTKNPDDEDTNTADLLTVGNMLEREEDLDYDTFGKSNVKQSAVVKKVTPSQGNSAVRDFENMDERMDALLSSPEKTTKKAAQPVYEAPAPQETYSSGVDTDQFSNMLDLNDYISQEASSSGGGGLFD